MKGLAKLRYLSLRRTEVTGVGFEHLSGLTALNIVYLDGAKINDESVEKLLRYLPRAG